jgi:NADH-quinone oxidoreductase subunit L
MIIATVVMIAAIYYAYTVYVKKNTLPADEGEELKPVHKLVYNKYWIDEAYEFLITKPLNAISEFFYKIVDTEFVDGIVNGVGKSVTWTSDIVRRLQTGNTGFYVFVMVVSIAVILFVQLF